MAVQLRTGKIGFAAFLHQARVPGFEDPECQCGAAEETVSHVVIFRPKHAHKRKVLTPKGLPNYNRVPSTNQGLLTLKGDL